MHPRSSAGRLEPLPALSGVAHADASDAAPRSRRERVREPRQGPPGAGDSNDPVLDVPAPVDRPSRQPAAAVGRAASHEALDVAHAVSREGSGDARTAARDADDEGARALPVARGRVRDRERVREPAEDLQTQPVMTDAHGGSAPGEPRSHGAAAGTGRRDRDGASTGSARVRVQVRGRDSEDVDQFEPGFGESTSSGVGAGAGASAGAGTGTGTGTGLLDEGGSGGGVSRQRRSVDERARVESSPQDAGERQERQRSSDRAPDPYTRPASRGGEGAVPGAGGGTGSSRYDRELERPQPHPLPTTGSRADRRDGSVDFSSSGRRLAPRERERDRDRDAEPRPDSREGRRPTHGRMDSGGVGSSSGNRVGASMDFSAGGGAGTTGSAGVNTHTDHTLRARDAESLPEVHVIGEIVGGTGFPSGVCCKWAFEFGDRWSWLQGMQHGQTHTDVPAHGPAVWCHPIDAHLLAGAVHGWPRILVQVWQLDDAGRADICGYGFCHVPNTAGFHKVTCATWRPVGTERQELSGYLLGGRPQLKSSDVIALDCAQRYNLTTAGSGTVHFELDVILKNVGSNT